MHNPMPTTQNLYAVRWIGHGHEDVINVYAESHRAALQAAWRAIPEFGHVEASRRLSDFGEWTGEPKAVTP